MKTILLSIFCVTAIILTSCDEKTSNKTTINEIIVANQTSTDSIELTKLIRQVYEWHETNEIDDFPYKYDNNQDSIFIGIDWEKYQDNIELFKGANFFSNYFLKRHKDIAKTLDSSIRKADITWRNINDGIPLWETGADDWCGCQDYPDNYWKLLTVDSLTVKENFADFIWTWDKNFSHTYKVTAKKEGGKWKINSLDGFKYFYRVEDYDKMMKDYESK